MKKNIVIFSDGTGQIGGEGTNTNIYKLFNLIEDRTEKQIAYYDPGIGTDWKKITGSIAGRGFAQNILDCYQFIFENFKKDDKIYLFGFSRGAATVRSLSAFINLFGILPKSRWDIIEQAFDIYKNTEKEDDVIKEAKAFIRNHHTMKCEIEFIGVWDTVAALGAHVKWLSEVLDILFPHRFHSFKLCENVKFARHALSIDEKRKAFHPKIWLPIDGKHKNERMKQVWFSGVHTDVGGGYSEDDLSNISLKWMIKESKAKGLLFKDESEAYKNFIDSNPNVNGIMHNEGNKFPGCWFKKEQRSWDKSILGEPCVHESVLKRAKNTFNKDVPVYSPWILDYMDKDNPCIECKK